MKRNLSVKIGKLVLKNPVMVASGTFGYIEEFKDFFNVDKLGAIVTKTITVKPRSGNLPPRTCETPSGLINSIGLENPGIDKFISEKLTKLKKLKTPLIVSIASEKDREEFKELISKLDKIPQVAAFELNISCPNVKSEKNEKQSLKLISQDKDATYNLLKSLRTLTKKTIITKLSPNVTDICQIAMAAEDAGTDAIALINTLSAMSININTRKPKIAPITGGLSGPAIRPIAVRMVYDAYRKIRIPIIGMGGIIDTPSALEFFIAGATAISIGTANFVNPKASVDIINGLKKYLEKNNIKDIKDLTGSLII